MKALKIIARVFYVLGLLALIGSIFYPTYVYDGEGRLINILYQTVDAIVIIAVAIGVVASFSEDHPLFSKVGLGLLIGGAIGAITLANIVRVIGAGLILLGLLFDFIAFLLRRGETNSNEADFDGKIERLTKLHKLLDDKIISEEEYNEMRIKILGLQKKKK